MSGKDWSDICLRCETAQRHLRRLPSGKVVRRIKCRSGRRRVCWATVKAVAGEPLYRAETPQALAASVGMKATTLMRVLRRLRLVRPWTELSHQVLIMCLGDRRLRTLVDIAECMNRPLWEVKREVEQLYAKAKHRKAVVSA